MAGSRRLAAIAACAAGALLYTGCAGKSAGCRADPGQKILCLEQKHGVGGRSKGAGRYEKEKAGLTSKLIREPAVPMRVPDTILRALVYPYESDRGTLHMARYIYMDMGDGRWILGEYLNRTSDKGGVIEPLTAETESGGGAKR